MKKNCGEDYKIVFAIRTGCKRPRGIKAVKPLSFEYFKEILSSGTVITNAGGLSYLPKRRGQLYINTWHGGGPYKKTSTDVYDNFWYRKEVKMNSDNIDYLLSSCEMFTDVEAKSMGFEREKCIPAGLPRNDILFQNHTRIAKKVRAYYSIPDGVKFVLYAPTFRSDNDKSTSGKVANTIDLNVSLLLDALKKRFDNDWVCGIRLHPKLSNMDLSSVHVINCTSYPDMQELLCCADVVITDYSSLMWDYSFTDRPVFLYAPDIDHYEKERGFYMPVSEWPYPIARSNEEMVDMILRFNETEYLSKVRDHHVACGSYESGTACETIVRLINGKRE